MLTLTKLDAEQVRGMYPWIERNFPEDECRPLAMMLDLMRRGLYEVIGVFDEGEAVGYGLSLLPDNSRAVLLDYLVVKEERRGQGLGGSILRLLRNWYAQTADVILIESEAPENAPDPAQAKRRCGFYERASCVELPFRVLLFGVDYAMYVLPAGETLPEADWESVVLDVYRQTLPPRFFASQVEIIRP